jgi:hypothetical protein
MGCAAAQGLWSSEHAEAELLPLAMASMVSLQVSRIKILIKYHSQIMKLSSTYGRVGSLDIY